MAVAAPQPAAAVGSGLPQDFAEYFSTKNSYRAIKRRLKSFKNVPPTGDDQDSAATYEATKKMMKKMIKQVER